MALEGIEFYYNDDLKGAVSRYTILRDAHGRGFEAENITGSDYSGKNLVLTIDSNIQYIAEKALAEAVKKFSAKSGMAIVMATKTGAILALAHFPFFNPNALNNFNQKIWRNRVITDPFEPGSTMKIFGAAAAIESGSCSPNSIFYCENGAYRWESTLFTTPTSMDGFPCSRSSNIRAISAPSNSAQTQGLNLYSKHCAISVSEQRPK